MKKIMTNPDYSQTCKKNNTKNEVSSGISKEKNTDDIKKLQLDIDKKIKEMPKEFGGRPKDKGLEPTRYNDWEFKGRCIDF